MHEPWSSSRADCELPPGREREFPILGACPSRGCRERSRLALGDSMTKPGPESLGFVASGTERIAVYRWGSDAGAKPPLMLVHGTGFVAPVWQAVAQLLAARYSVYAIDRRGHGRSSKPADAYHFLDFCDDLCSVIDALGLERIYGVGHSAGATDVLLSAARRPGSFDRVFAMEPTLMDPRDPADCGELETQSREMIESTRRRRSRFASPQAVLERYSSRPVFSRWQPELLEIYANQGFDSREDGQIELCCSPEIEAAMLGPIIEAMDRRYLGDARGNPFAMLREVACPVRISTTGRSSEIYKAMAVRAAAMIPHSTPVHFVDSGHCAPQEQPAEVAEALVRFADDAPNGIDPTVRS